MSELVPGGNCPLPEGALTLSVPGPFDLSLLITGDSGKVSGDGDFVFFNQPSAPGARLNGDTLVVDPRRLRPGAGRVTVVVSPAASGTPLGALPVPSLRVTGRGGAVLARFTPPRPTRETVLLLAELYRRGDGWKLRALGQGYAEGLAGVARDFGVEVADDGGGGASASVAPAAPVRPPRSPRPPGPPGPPPSGARTAVAAGGPSAPDGVAYALAELVNRGRVRTGAPAVTVEPRLVAAAGQHAAGMAARERLGAEGPDGVSLFQRVAATGYVCLSLAEHLVSGPRTAAGFAEYCLEGADRRAPLGDPVLTQLGVGLAPGRSGDTYWTAVWAEPFTPAGLARTVAEVVALTNAERAAAGLPPLATDPALAGAARAHSGDMVVRDFYAHTSPEGTAPWDRAAAAGSRHRGIGENIACGQRTPAEVVRGWMNSPGHRANILKRDFTHIGVGCATGGRSGTYWTQVFGIAR